MPRETIRPSHLQVFSGDRVMDKFTNMSDQQSRARKLVNTKHDPHTNRLSVWEFVVALFSATIEVILSVFMTLLLIVISIPFVVCLCLQVITGFLLEIIYFLFFSVSAVMTYTSLLAGVTGTLLLIAYASAVLPQYLTTVNEDLPDN